jgi:putative chitinase
MSDIDLISPQLLLLAVDQPRTLAELEPWAEAIRKACRSFEINTVRRIAAFIAQMAHESDLKARDENLHYSVDGLMKTFSRYRISAEDCRKYGRCADHPADPQMIANCIYGGEWGKTELGNVERGDGWLFRGAGPLQLTGRHNFAGFAHDMAITLPQALEYARTLEGGIMAAAWFWEENDINRLADTPGVTDETRRINGGTLGLMDRRERFNRLVDGLLRAERKAPA